MCPFSIYYNWGKKTQQDETSRQMYYLYNHSTPILLLSLRLLAFPQFILSCPIFIFLSQTCFPLQFPCNTMLYHTLTFQAPLSLLIIDNMKCITLTEDELVYVLRVLYRCVNT